MCAIRPPLTPNISVLVSTRNRPEQVATCVRHVLANSDVDFELIVVDQSPGEQCEWTRRAVGSDVRVRWIESSTQGLSISRNVGLSFARAPLIVFTDDDCEVPTSWLASIQREFQADERIDMLFGAVALPAGTGAAGYAAQFEPEVRAEFSGSIPDIRAEWESAPTWLFGAGSSTRLVVSMKCSGQVLNSAQAKRRT